MCFMFSAVSLSRPISSFPFNFYLWKLFSSFLLPFLSLLALFLVDSWWWVTQSQESSGLLSYRFFRPILKTNVKYSHFLKIEFNIIKSKNFHQFMMFFPEVLMILLLKNVKTTNKTKKTLRIILWGYIFITLKIIPSHLGKCFSGLKNTH